VQRFFQANAFSMYATDSISEDFAAAGFGPLFPISELFGRKWMGRAGGNPGKRGTGFKR
jgi:hypothetical protein